MKYIKLDPNVPDLKRWSDSAVGYDLYTTEDVNTYTLLTYQKIPTGIAIELPQGFMGMVVLRSSLSSKIAMPSPGIIDPDYRGEIFVPITKVASGYTIKKYERIAQLIIIPVNINAVELTPELSQTIRNTGGFGSTNQ